MKEIRFAALFISLSCIFLMLGCDQSKEKKAKNNPPPTPREQAIAMISNPISDINPAQLCPIFTIGSSNTDLQRERIEGEITGKHIIWRLRVYEVSSTKNQDIYQIQTQACIPQSGSNAFNQMERDALSALRQMGELGSILGNTLEVNRNIGTIINLTVLNENDRQKIHSLKTDDWIFVQGRIKGTFLRNIIIEPAVFAESAKNITYQNSKSYSQEAAIPQEGDNNNTQQQFKTSKEIDVVKNFYLALAAGDGKLANTYLIPEKRNIGNYQEDKMSSFYGSMNEHLKVTSMKQIDSNQVEVKYTYRHTKNQCIGTATVEIEYSMGDALIKRIKANC